LGRWVSTDPAGIIGGLNAFGANRNNPVAYVDRTGKHPILWVFAFLAVVVLDDHDKGTNRTNNAKIKSDMTQLTGKLSAIGLPVSMLETVNSSTVTFNYSEEGAIGHFSPSDQAEYNRITDEIFVSKTDLDDKQDEMLNASSIGTLFHEFVHAWFEMNEDGAEVKHLIESGTKYYENAPLFPPPGSSGPQVASDPERIFQEAAAHYIGFRVEEWLKTYKRLQGMLDPEAEVSRGDLKDVIDSYNRRVGRQDFGYEEDCWGTQFPTTKAISPELRSYLDQVVLEGKMPSNFDDDEILRGMSEAILAQKAIK
jgi:hypothetical protein